MSRSRMMISRWQWVVVVVAAALVCVVFVAAFVKAVAW